MANPPHDAFQEQAVQYARTFAQQLGQIQTLEMVPCTSQLFLSGDSAWMVQATLASGDETVPFLMAWRQNQFAATMINDFVLSIAGHLESAWQERGYPEAEMTCDWHPPLEDVTIPELAQASERDDVWVIEIATSLGDAADVAVPTVYSLIWLRYADQACEIRVIHTQTQPFSVTEQERN
ncbi:MAG: hypothetical protein WCD86_16955 [Ktedonobacteraceae bacterium]